VKYINIIKTITYARSVAEEIRQTSLKYLANFAFLVTSPNTSPNF